MTIHLLYVHKITVTILITADVKHRQDRCPALLRYTISSKVYQESILTQVGSIKQVEGLVARD
jgi:hypothetical protein